MAGHPRLSELTAAQIFERAARFAEKARAPDTAECIRASFHRLAIRYARLAAEREIEEGRPVRH